MPALIRYVITRMSTGFAIGAGAALALIVFTPAVVGAGVLESLLLAYGLGSTFATGYLATALALDAEN